MQKRIRCYCHGPIAFGSRYKSPWEDVWLKWKGKPGRAVYRAAPTLMCRQEIVADMEMHEHIRADRQGHKMSLGPSNGFSSEAQWTHSELSEAEWQEKQSRYRDDDEECHGLLAQLDRQQFVINGAGSLASVYTNANGIDRAEAERMLAYFLRDQYDIHNPKFVWDKPDRELGAIMPHSFGDYATPV